MYRCEAVSVAGFVQQLAVSYVRHGHFFYVMGQVPEGKCPYAVDRKLVECYGIHISKWARARAKASGRASVQYLRHGRLFVLLATHGNHEFFERESGIKDLRREPIQLAGYSISYRKGADRRWHVSVRIAPGEYLKLKVYFVGLACHRSVERLQKEFQRIPFEPYAPVRRQLLNVLRAVNRAREAAAFEALPTAALYLRRRIVKPFGEHYSSIMGKEAA